MRMQLTSIRASIMEKKFPFFFGLFLLVIGAIFFVYSNSTFEESFAIFSSDAQPSNPAPSVPSNQTISTRNDDVITDEGDQQPQVEQLPEWRLCREIASTDYIPCLDNRIAIKELKSRKHMEHRERHCPDPAPQCLVPHPPGYKAPIPWPKSRDTIWYDNVPHPGLVEYKKDQNWVRLKGKHLVFPGGGTQFKHGVGDYINFVERTLPNIKWGFQTRVVLDVGCGVASFGGYLLDKNVITMSFAPKDEHEAQIQFALERGIPATLAVIGTRKLPFPDNAFDLIHCARCRVHWEADGGKPLIELNRILRPGGYFVWSATPVYRDDERDLKVWRTMEAITEDLCWKAVARTVDSSGIGLVIYQKPTTSSCYKNRKPTAPPLCANKTADIPWYTALASCISNLPPHESKWPMKWPERLNSVALTEADAERFAQDTKDWASLVSKFYLNGLSLNWSLVRNILDMNAGYGGFAASLVNRPYWVMNVIPVSGPDTLPVIYDRGLIGLYHDWCESLSTYPRTYDLLHASFLIRNITERCDIASVAAEIDRVTRPGGYLVVRDSIDVLNNISTLFKSLHWSTGLYHSQFMVAQKGYWRPT